MERIPKINPFKTINTDYQKMEEKPPSPPPAKPIEKIYAQGRYLPTEELGSPPIINDIRNGIEQERRIHNLNESFRFNSTNNTYVISSHHAKINMINMRKKLLTMMFLDICSNLFYGITFPPMFYLIPFISLGLYGAYKYQDLVLKIFQIYLVSNIILKVYLSSITQGIPQKILWIGFVPYDFYLLYKCWIFIWELKILNSYDRNELLKGWTPSHYALSVL